MVKITNLETKTTTTGKEYKTATIDGKTVSIWPWKYSLYAALENGKDFDGKVVADGKYNNLVDDVPDGAYIKVNTGKPPKNIAAAMEKKAEYIEQAQERKSDSIAYFNSLNSAIALYPHMKGQLDSDGEVRLFLKTWRDWFLKEYADYKERPPF